MLLLDAKVSTYNPMVQVRNLSKLIDSSIPYTYPYVVIVYCILHLPIYMFILFLFLPAK